VQNAFIQLQKYIANGNDPQENRATEALAACLTFSVPLRRLFMEFLFGRELPGDDKGSFDIWTQVPTDDKYWIDLLIEQPGILNIAAEVKVKQKEDGEQIRKYSKWLQKTKKGNNYIFHLVKHHEKSFDITKHGGVRYLTWRDWYETIKKFRNEEPESTDGNLAGQFCNFLEMEGIVSTWSPTDIFPYLQGVKARDAVENLFGQLTERFHDPSLAEQYATHWEWAKHEGNRPYFMAGMKSWTNIFGKDTDLQRAMAVYEAGNCSSGLDDSPAISYEIVLWWPGFLKGNWAETRKKIQNWVGALEAQGYKIETFGRRWKPIGVPSYELEDAPVYVSAQNKLKSITRGRMGQMTSEELVDAVHKCLLDQCTTVSQLS
jgi:hypothetical protein